MLAAAAADVVLAADAGSTPVLFRRPLLRAAAAATERLGAARVRGGVASAQINRLSRSGETQLRRERTTRRRKCRAAPLVSGGSKGIVVSSTCHPVQVCLVPGEGINERRSPSGGLVSFGSTGVERHVGISSLCLQLLQPADAFRRHAVPVA